MRPFQIFKAGKHTAANGATLSFSEGDLQAAVEAYDPDLHEAPIVVGHPKDNGPAYGWIKSLAFAEDEGMVAEPDQIDADFAEMVEKGRFKKRSASFYSPNAPGNPVPGVYYLRHVGFLGAQPPAVKGLKDVEFSDQDEGVVEFTDPYVVASLFRRLREFFINKYSIDDADKVIPDFLVQDLEAEARAPAQDTAQNFTELHNGDTDMTPEQIEAMRVENEALKSKAAKYDQGKADFAEKQADLEKKLTAISRANIETEVDGLVSAGKVLPAQRDNLVNFMTSLDDETTVVEFGEGDQAEKLSARSFMTSFLNGLPKRVDFSERAGAGEGGADFTEEQEIINRVVKA